VARAGRELGKAQGAQRPPDRRLIELDADLLKEPARQVLAPPTDHAVDGRDRTALHHPGQSLALVLVQLGAVARRLAVDEPLGTVLVEAQHPVPHDLKRDAADPGCVRSGAAVVNLRERQQTTGLGGVRALFGAPAQSRTVEIRAQSNRRSHGEPPLVRHSESDFRQSGNPTSLTSRPLV
jgi:hypothetical protein